MLSQNIRIQSWGGEVGSDEGRHENTVQAIQTPYQGQSNQPGFM